MKENDSKADTEKITGPRKDVPNLLVGFDFILIKS